MGTWPSGRVLDVLAVVEQLAVGGRQVVPLALVLPGEEAALPDVGEAVPSPAFGEPLLEGVVLAGGSASWGVGSPSIRHRSMKCSCDAAFSVVVTPRHFSTNAFGVRVGWVDTLPSPRSTRPGRREVDDSAGNRGYGTSPCSRWSLRRRVGRWGPVPSVGRPRLATDVGSAACC